MTRGAIKELIFGTVEKALIGVQKNSLRLRPQVDDSRWLERAEKFVN
jgi:hypothetical protein